MNNLVPLALLICTPQAGPASPTPPRDASAEAFRIEARLDAGPLASGVDHTLAISFTLSDGWMPILAGAPASALRPLVQFDVPAGIEWVGRSAVTPAELRRAKYVDLPYERLLELPETRVAFRVTGELAPDAALEFNALLYGVAPEDGRAHAVRHRYRIPLRPDARAQRVPVSTASWGRGPRLRLGDALPSATFERVFGPELDLDELRARDPGPLVVLTYHSCL